MTPVPTALPIARPLAAIRDARRIAVVPGGPVAEAGTHAELLARGGAHAGLPFHAIVG